MLTEANTMLTELNRQNYASYYVDRSKYYVDRIKPNLLVYIQPFHKVNEYVASRNYEYVAS